MKFLLLLLIPLLAFYQPKQDKKPNGFDVSITNIDASAIRKGGPPRDGIPSIDSPKFITLKEATWLKDKDPVIGIEVNGIARAYPLRILQYHECVNDLIGDQAIAVTYCPLCQSSFTFDRTFNDVVYDFGTSGMLWNSNVLLYDRQTESLWSQAAMKAVTGEAAKQNLTFKLLPTIFSTWKEWRTSHPNTTVLSKETGFERNYSVYNYARYFKEPEIWFDVDSHLDNPRAFALKEKMLLVRFDKMLRLYSIEELTSAAGDSNTVSDTFNNQTITIHLNAETGTAKVLEDVPSATMYWFAASACLPKATLWTPPESQKTPE